MPQWMDELDNLIKGMEKPAPPQDDEDDDDGFDGDGDGDGMENDGEEDEQPVKKAASSREGCYPTADNGDDDDENGEMPNGAKVRDADKIERYTKKRGGGKITRGKINAGDKANTVAKGIRDLVDSDAADVIDGAHALGQIADAVDNLVGSFGKSLRRFEARIAELEDGQALIGQAVTKSLRAVQGEVEQIARQPRGRKAVTKGVDRKFAGSDTPAPQDRMEVMQKSLKALQDGRISAVESASVDSFMNRGIPLPPALLAKINGPSG